jgi:hypothetical protein
MYYALASEYNPMAKANAMAVNGPVNSGSWTERTDRKEYQ